MSFREMAIGLLALVLVGAAGVAPATAADDTEVENLCALARLYGYLRYFCPEDGAAAADWDDVLVDAVAPVRQATSPEQLQQVLEEHLQGLAPSLQLMPQSMLPAQEPWAPEAASATPGAVAWQHVGVGTYLPEMGYASLRTGRPNQRPVLQSGGYELFRYDAAIAYRGKRIRMQLAVMDAAAGAVELELQVVDRPAWQVSVMDSTVVTGAGWQLVELSGDLPGDALALCLNLRVMGDGVVWVDDDLLQVETADGGWLTVDTVNGDFEDPVDTMLGWYSLAADLGVVVSPDGNVVHGGQRSLRLLVAPARQPTRLFDLVPGSGDTLRAVLGAGVGVSMPLRVDEGPRGPEAPGISSGKRVRQGGATADTAARRAAVAIEAWALLQHFYPYFDVVDVDWDEVLSATLRATLDAATEMDFLMIMKTLSAAIADGHANVIHRGLEQLRGWLPVRTEMVEGQVVVLGTAATELKVGDIILEIDGRPVAEVVEGQLGFVSGSPQRALDLALTQLGAGDAGSVAVVRVDRDGEELEVELRRAYAWGVSESRPRSFSEVDDGIVYVDLTSTSMLQIAERFDEINTAQGVIFDLRGYPVDGDLLLHHLVDEPVRSARWMRAQTIYPDHRDVVGWNESGRWLVEPRAPRIGCPAAFLIDVRSFSYAESILEIVASHRLAALVGRPTAGATGNANLATLPSGFEMTWTGMKVLTSGGEVFHNVGVQPTVPVSRSIAGVRAMIDEDVQAAVGALRNGTAAP